MAVSVLKGGGALMRNIGGGVGCGSARPLCCRYCHCHWQLKRNENGNGNLKITMRSRTISLSPSAATAARRIFCTAFQNLMDSSDPSSSSSSSSSSACSSTVDGDGLDSDLKNAANMLDIRVGRILRAWRHEEADSLYVEEVDIGEPQPRIICSGLVNYIPLHQLQDSNVVVLANLKPRNMRGVKSFGMLMAASDTTHENVELLVPPEGSLPGERIWFGSADEKENLPVAATPNQIQKKKIWEFVQPHLRTDTSCAASLGVHFMRTSVGVVLCQSLKNANIS